MGRFKIVRDEKAHAEYIKELIDLNIWPYLIQCLKENEADNKHGFWTDGSQILCKTEEAAENVANFLEDLGLTDITTGHYDPNEDERSGINDEYTGYYYISNDSM